MQTDFPFGDHDHASPSVHKPLESAGLASVPRMAELHVGRRSGDRTRDQARVSVRGHAVSVRRDVQRLTQHLHDFDLLNLAKLLLPAPLP
jgi:hypothetical protein